MAPAVAALDRPGCTSFLSQSWYMFYPSCSYDLIALVMFSKEYTSLPHEALERINVSTQGIGSFWYHWSQFIWFPVRHYSTSSRPALGPTHPPKQWVAGALSPGVKRQGRESDHSPPSNAEVKNGAVLYPRKYNSSACYEMLQRAPALDGLFGTTEATKMDMGIGTWIVRSSCRSGS
jgi:hypothetical protein